MIVGDTQQKLLAQLLECKAGLTVDELAVAADITRSAVKQHLSGMERSGYVQHTSSKSGGRPRFLYTLTESGIEKFTADWDTRPEFAQWLKELTSSAQVAGR